MKCYYCQAEVSEEEHTNVQKAMMVVCAEVCDSDLHISVAEDSFVHMRSTAECEGPALDGFEPVPVVCAKDFVREISEHYSHSHFAVR